MHRLAPALALTLLVASLTSPALATIRLVKADGTGDYPTIQAAVDAAVDGDEVHLVAGTYEGEGNRNVDVGGKAITVRSQSGDPTTTIVNCYQGTDTSRAFILDSGEGEHSVLEALSIGGGNTDSFTEPSGTVRCVGSSPTIRNCIFRGNVGSSLANSDGSPTIVGCVFFDNWSFNSEGMGVNSYGGGPLIKDCTFTENYSNGGAAAMSIGTGTISHCTFTGNTGYTSGGAVSASGTTIEDCVFLGNGGTWNGGALSMSAGTVRRCYFGGNFAENGGAISTGGSVTIEACTLSGNNGRYYGDSIYVFGGLLDLHHSIIAFGGSQWNLGPGAGVLLSGGSANISCTDIYGNDYGDWEGTIADQLGQDGNISAAPLFCPGVDGIYSNSPCAPANSGGCGLIGAHGVACDPSTVEAMSWGEIKGMYK